MLAVLWWWGPRSDPAGTLAPTIGPGDGRAFPASVTDYQECFSFFGGFYDFLVAYMNLFTNLTHFKNLTNMTNLINITMSNT